MPVDSCCASGRRRCRTETLADGGFRGSFTDVDSYGRPGANELYDLVRREAFGEKVFFDIDGADQDRVAKREGLNNDIATVKDAFNRYEAETGVDPATLPREQQREIALGGLNALEQGESPADIFQSEGFRQWFGDRSIEQLEADYAALVDEKGNNRTDDGHKIDTDLVRELAPDYVADRSRSQELHPYASALTKELFRRALARPVREGKSPVVAFLAGGGGSGKSTAGGPVVNALNPDITYDGTLSKLGAAKRMIEAALEGDKRKVAVVFVYRSPAKAAASAIARAIDNGRPVPVWALADAHAGAPATVKALAKEYDGDDRVKIDAIWNDGERGQERKIPVEEIPYVDRDEAEHVLREAVEAERTAGKLSDKLHAAFTVREGLEVAGGVDGQGDRGPAQAGSESAQDALTQDPAAGGVSASGDSGALNQSSDDGFSEEGRRQAREVERAYGGREGYERDKAAGRTKLTYGQWVQVRTPAFLEWFGDWMNDPANASKVVDPETGEPRVVYHGTIDDFNAFSDAHRGKVTRATSSMDGHFFASTPRTAESYAHHAATVAPIERLVEESERLERRQKRDEAAAKIAEAERLEDDMRKPDGRNRGQTVMPVFLAIKNPLVEDAERETPNGIGGINPLIRSAKAGKRDGVIIQNFDDAAGLYDEIADHYIAFSSNQIKSATANNGDFSEDPNILRQRGANRGPRGQIVGRDGQSIIGQKAEDGSREFNITLFEGKDLSTVLHEAGHAFFEIFGDLAEDASASEQLKADYAALLAWAKVKDRSEVGRTPVFRHRLATWHCAKKSTPRPACADLGVVHRHRNQRQERT